MLRVISKKYKHQQLIAAVEQKFDFSVEIVKLVNCIVGNLLDASLNACLFRSHVHSK